MQKEKVNMIQVIEMTDKQKKKMYKKCKKKKLIKMLINCNKLLDLMVKKYENAKKNRTSEEDDQWGL